MPRNGSGTFTLAQPAFVSGTKISSSAMNSDMSDIAAALTQSYSADGQTPFTGIFKNADGSAGAPSYTWSADTGTGFYRVGTGNIGITCGGTQVASLSASGFTWSVGQTFSSSVTFNGTTFTWGAGAANAFINSLATEVDLTPFIDGGGAVIANSTPNPILWFRIPCALTINTWSLVADQSGSITIDVLRTNAAFPSTSIIGAGTKPSLSSAQTSIAQTPSSWTSTSLAKGDFIGFVTSGAATLTKLNITLACTRTAA